MQKEEGQSQLVAGPVDINLSYGVFKPIVYLVWSESVDEFLNFVFSLIWFHFTQKNAGFTANHMRKFTTQLCLGKQKEYAEGKKFLTSGLEREKQCNTIQSGEK